jgi:hypothetical protein
MSNGNLELSLTMTADGKVLSAEVKRATDDVEKFSDSLSDNKRASDNAGKGVEDYGKKSKKSTTEVDRLKDKTRSLGRELFSLKGILAGLGISLLAGQFITTNTEADALRGSLVTMTGSLERSGLAFDKLTAIASRTPYTLDQSVNAFIKLTALGLTPSERAILSYGNTAAAMGKDLNQMIEAVADASTFEFERLKEFGIKASQEGDKVSFTFQGVTTTVKKNAEEIQDYLLSIGETKFGDAMAQQMNRLPGQFSNLEDAVDGFWRALGDAGGTDILASGITSLTGAIQGLTSNVDALIAMAETAGLVLGTGGALYVGLALAPALLAGATKGFQVLTFNALATWVAMRAGVSPLTALNTNLWGTSVSSQAAAGGMAKLKIAAGVLFAAFAGWEIGTTLRDQFLEVRLAGIAFVDAMLKGWEHLKYGFDVAVLAVEAGWDGAINNMRRSFADWLETISGWIGKIPGFGGISNEVKEFSQSLRNVADDGVNFEEGLKKLNDQHDEAIKKVQTITDDMVDYEIKMANAADVTGDTSQSLEDLAKNGKEGADGTDKLTKSAQDLLTELRNEKSLLGLSARERAIRTNLIKAGTDATDKEREAIRKLTGEIYDQEVAIKAQKAVIEENKRIWEEATNRIHEAFSDAWKGAFDSFEDFSDRLKDAFKQLLAELAHQAITKPILVQLGLGGSGSGGLLGGGGSSSGSIIDTVSNLWSAVSSGGGLLGSITSGLAAGGVTGAIDGAAGYAMSSYINGGAYIGNAAPASYQMANQGLVSEGMTATVNSVGNAITNAALSAAAAYIGGQAGDAIGEAVFNKQAEHSYGQIAGGIGGAVVGSATLGATYGSMAGPIGALIGAAIGALVDVAAGGDGKKRYNLGVSTGAESIDSRYAKDTIDLESGLQLTSITRRVGREGNEAAASMLDAFSAIDANLVRLADNLGQAVDLTGVTLTGKNVDAGHEGKGGAFFGSAAYNGVSEQQMKEAAGAFWFAWGDAVGGEVNALMDRLTAGLSVAEVSDNVDNLVQAMSLMVNSTGEFKHMMNSLADSYSGVDENGRTNITTLIELAGNLVSVNTVLETLSVSSLGFNQIGIDSAKALTDMYGGLEGLGQAAGLYLETFTTSEEKLANFNSSIAATFSEMGLALPSTRDGFRSLVEGLDLTSEAARQQFGTLMTLVPAMDQYYQGTESLAASITTLYQDILGREPETEGLEYWVNEVAHTGLTLDQVAGSIAMSNEALTNKITALYQDILGREPEAEGLEYWINEVVNSGLTIDEVAQSIGQSSEAIAKANAEIQASIQGEANVFAIGLAEQNRRESLSPMQQAEEDLQAWYDTQLQAVGDFVSAGVTFVDGSESVLADINAIYDRGLEDIAERFADLGDAVNDVGDGIGDVVDTIDEDATRLAEIASERASLETRLLQLQGDTTELRKREKAALDESNHELYDRITALEDEQATNAENARKEEERLAAQRAINAENENLQTRLLQLQGDTTELRKREKEALDSSNHELYDRITALEDEQALNAENARKEEAQLAAKQAILAEQESLETRLLQLQGDTTELRKREKEALDSANHELYDRITALEEEQATAAENARKEEARLAAQQSILAEQESLETRLLQLQGDTVELRSRERAALDPANQALYDRIIALEDEQAVAADLARQEQEQLAARQSVLAEYENLENRFLQLQGDTVELRRREREALDPANRAIYDRIIAMEDEQAASAEAARQLQEQQALMQAVASERESLEVQLLQLQGDTVELRNRERAQLDPTNQAIFDRIKALEDEQAAAAHAAQLLQQQQAELQAIANERASLETQLLQLQGDTVELRNREREALHESNRPLYDQIKALEDQAAALTEANDATAELIAAEQELSSQRQAEAEERKGLEMQYLQLIGDTAAIRAIERAELFEGNRTLYDRIKGLSDEQAANEEAARLAEEKAAQIKAVNDERYGLETELLQLQGNTVALREREKAKLNESNRALYDQINALKDQKEAAEDATRAGQSLVDEILRLRGLDGSSTDDVGQLRTQFLSMNQRALLGDVQALNQLPKLSQALEDSARDQSRNELEFARTVSWLANTLDETTKALQIDAHTLTTGFGQDSAFVPPALSAAAAHNNEKLDAVVIELREVQRGLSRIEAINEEGFYQSTKHAQEVADKARKWDKVGLLVNQS